MEHMMEPDSPSVGTHAQPLQESATIASPSVEPPSVPHDLRLQLEGTLAPDAESAPRRGAMLGRVSSEVIAWVKTLASAAVYATLIVTFGVQVARVEGQSMAPTLVDQDRLIVNKFTYRFCISIPPLHLGCRDPRPSDIVMLYYPVDPDKSFVKRVIAEAGDTVRISDGRVFVKRSPGVRRVRRARLPKPRQPRAGGHPRRLLFRDGRPPQQQLRQPPLGLRPQEIHHRQGPAAVVAHRPGASVLGNGCPLALLAPSVCP